ncbi:type I-E CRISPR-associated protein Cas7/Cse4/CasC [Lentzea sp. NBRC 105346]|uniref:type I-E CRISPR-associated protein Cas7/Cse4/CasC n=1 Tax=Lentzea sp. NBRC 105346 TaxID=3032205 RepID=UPI0024A1E672|nr:type I-E CRISPR-associated protein Cas7/Cse4/CasC [Lentzea sp. NBRC 105346]GLZ28139.1 type I-E CRISPR-associated protein Cas7/Cse4/CasC [Lentzea sp. NBRC 105346]
MPARRYLDIHVLQTVPPSNLNRDDAGSPKQAIYGGARRARVSSQAWKRATRTAFAERVPKADLATRTKQISDLLTKRLTEAHDLAVPDAARISNALLKPLGIKASKKNAEQTSYLLFFGYPQLAAIAETISGRIGELIGLDDAALDKAVEEVDVKAILGTGHPVDVALFGRMVADIPNLNVDAACQVAHAISTHPVEIEFDYYTAVDDENTDNKGAGMIGTVEFNSATLYRYATLGLQQLEDNLGGANEVPDAVELFVDCFARSIPSGHGNSFAHRTLPSLVAVVAREDQPVNLVSAFEKPVRSRDGVLAESAARLAAELASATDNWGQAPTRVLACYNESTEDLSAVFGASQPFPDLLTDLKAFTAEWLGQGSTR